MAQLAKANVPSLPLVLKLPHPYLTTYVINNTAAAGEPIRHQVSLSSEDSIVKGITLPTALQNDAISFNDIASSTKGDAPPKGDNSSWARARRSPYLTLSWTGEKPSVPQLWLITYALVTLHPLVESFRVLFSGIGSETLAEDLFTTGLFHPHPNASDKSSPHDGHLLLRSTFWQGAGSPFGTRPVWTPLLDASGKPKTRQYPPFPFQNAPTTQFPAVSRHTMHPAREPKPEPGSIIYSRWIPHLGEHLSMVALDYNNDEHLRLFNAWQNDPRVAAAWNETGTLDQHREYLRRMHKDPHVLTVLGAFDGNLFAYFEFYWAMESPMGAHYQSSQYDRGKHLLVGDSRFRGPHRTAAWWSACLHYCFLDEPRTWTLVGEPSVTSSAVLAYDAAHGLHIDKIIDLPHKRSALIMVNREKFFTLSTFVWNGEKKVTPSPDAVAKL